MPGLHYEEFSVGQAFVHPWPRTVTEMDNTMFSLLTMNPQPLHADAHFAAGTEWGQRLFNSLYALGLPVVSLRESRSRPDVGLVGFEHAGLNQRGEVAAICRRTAMLKKKSLQQAQQVAA